MEMSDALQMLGLSKIPSDKATLHKAWHAAASRTHPDKGGTTEKFKCTKEAFDYLTERMKLKQPQMEKSSLNEVTITLEQLLTGYTLHVHGGKCGVCTAGFQDIKEAVECSHCDGTGQARIKRGMISSWKTCDFCGGIGVVKKVLCLVCSGTGTSQQGEDKILLPAWLEDGHVTELKGRNGIIRVLLKLLKSDGLRKRGIDLMKDVDVPYDVMCLGGNFSTIIPGCGTLSFNINELSLPGSIITVSNEGIADFNGKRGNIYLKLNVEIPKAITVEQKQVLMEWRKVR